MNRAVMAAIRMAVFIRLNMVRGPQVAVMTLGMEAAAEPLFNLASVGRQREALTHLGHATSKRSVRRYAPAAGPLQFKQIQRTFAAGHADRAGQRADHLAGRTRCSGTHRGT